MATLQRNTVSMTQTTDSRSDDSTNELSMDDPRQGFAVVTEALSSLMASTSAEQHSLPTPCTEFSVKDLLDHLVLVMQRVAVLGNGGHWSEATEELASRDAGHTDAFRSAAHDVMEAWTDPAKLESMYEVPWGTLPGGPLILTYTAELATHGWDLAAATGQSFTIPDQHLGGALFAARMLPAEGRDDPMMPFDPVVDPGAEAPLLLQIAGWMGRQVI